MSSIPSVRTVNVRTVNARTMNVRTATLRMLLSAALAALLFTGLAGAQEAPVDGSYFDTDRQEWLVDSDRDGYVDLLEETAGTDPHNAKEMPVAAEARAEDPAVGKAAGFPTPFCRAGFRQIGSRLCASTTVQNATWYDWASVRCRNQRARVCTYEDLFYIYDQSGFDASYNPNGRWIGHFVDDDDVLCGNRDITTNGDADQFNFEHNCNKNASRAYFCCHDRE